MSGINRLRVDLQHNMLHGYQLQAARNHTGPAGLPFETKLATPACQGSHTFG